MRECVTSFSEGGKKGGKRFLQSMSYGHATLTKNAFYKRNSLTIHEERLFIQNLKI